MKCPHCGRRNPGASWYCAHCGRPFPDVNVAGSVGDAGTGRWRGPLALVGMALVALGGVALLVWQGGRPEQGGRATPVAVTVVAGAPTELPATSTPRPTPRIVTAVPGGADQPSPTPPGTAVPTATVPRGQPTWRIGYLMRPPLLDGVLDEWRGRPLGLGALVFGGEFWSGADDLSARAYAGYDRQQLYLAADVQDDVFSQPSRGLRLYLGDSLELQLDADLAGDRDVAVHNGDDFQIGLSPGNFAGAEPEAHIWRPEDSAARDIKVAATRTATGYTIEAAIPWRLLGIDPEQTTSLGLALNVSDNDFPEPAQLTMLSSTPNRDWTDPRSFGTLVLVPMGGVTPP